MTTDRGLLRELVDAVTTCTDADIGMADEAIRPAIDAAIDAAMKEVA